MVFSDFVTTVTQDKIAPSIVDTVLGSNVLTLRLMANPREWSGETLKIGIKTSKSSAGGSFDGFDTFSTSQPSTRQQMSFNPKGHYQSVTINNLQKAVNSTDEKVLDLIKVEMESAQQDMVDSIGTLLYSDGTGNGSKDFTGLAAAVDDGSVAATYGGLSRSTVTTIQSTVTTGVGALTLSAMATMYNACATGSDRPTLIVTTEAVWGFYEALLQPTVSANYDAGGFQQVTSTGIVARGGLKGEIGFDALFYRGVPIVKDEKCTSGYMYFLNEKYLHWYSLPHPDGVASHGSSSTIDGPYGDAPAMMPIHWTGFKKPVNQDAVVGQFIVYGDLVNRNPKRSGVLQGITS